MAAIGTLMFQDPAITTPGAVRGWKIAFGYTSKGTVCVVYLVAADGGGQAVATEIPTLANGRADLSAISAWLGTYGVNLTNAVKQVVGA